MTTSETEAPEVIQRSSVGIAGSIFVTVLVGALGLIFLVAAVMLIASGHSVLGLFILALAGVLAVLFRYVLRDTRGKRGWQIEITNSGVHVDLPAGRSLTHHLDAVNRRVPFDEIDAIETRLEAYRSFGMANMQRSYALKLKTGEPVVLGEDRALGTRLQSEHMARAVERIARRGGLSTRDLGMVEGRGGILSVLFAQPPSWDAPSLPHSTRNALWRRARVTGAVAGIVLVIILFAMFMT